MQQLPIPPSQIQLYQQPSTFPTYTPPVEQRISPISSNPPVSLPNFPSVDSVQKSTDSPSSNIPDAETVRTQLTNAKAVPLGIKNGLIFGALASLPIWGIEQAFKKNGHQEGNLIQQLVTLTELSCRPENQLKWSKKLAEKIEKPIYSFLTSAAGTMTVGLITGGTLGWWGVKHIKDKLLDINQMKTEQQNGTFQPKPLTIAQRLGLSKKPTNNPDQDYQDLLQNNLNPNQAFKQGAYDVAMFKVGPAVLSLGTIGGFWGLSKAFGFNTFMNPQQFKKIMAATFHPVFIAKLVAMPIIGGLIAKQTVPWAKQQLGIDQKDSKPVTPSFISQEMPITTQLQPS